MILFFALIFLAKSVFSVENDLKRIYPLFGLTEKAIITKNQSLCNVELKSVHSALNKREIWALRMLDSSGSPRNGFILGNNYWLGSYSQCKWVSSKRTVSSGKRSSSKSLEFPPFDVDFYVASFNHNFSYQAQVNESQEDLILLGLCLPSSCSIKDIEPLLISWTLQNSLTVQFLYNFTMKFHNLRLIKQETLFNYPLLILLSSIVMVIVLIVIFATFYELYVLKPMKKCKFPSSDANSNQWGTRIMRNIRESDELLDRDNNLNNECELKIDNFSHKSIPAPIVVPESENIVRRRQRRFFLKIFTCFSVTSNVKLIMRTKVSGKEDVPAVHGLRFIAMIWIISLYTVYYLEDFSDNKPLLNRLSQRFSEQVISNSTFSVDTFFFTSGFLLSYVYYRNRRGSSRVNDSCSAKRNVNEFSCMLLNRFVRLTPMYLIVLMIANITNKRNNRTSLFEVAELSENVCEKYWWRNVLYINNLFNADEMCMSWSWYLSTEMQFFMLGCALLILSSRYWKLSVGMIGCLILGSSLMNGYLSYVFSISPTFDQRLASLYRLHYPPWMRIGPYLIGLSSGYLAIHLKGELNCNKATLITCWTVASICSLWPLFGLYNKDMSLISTALYNALSRPAWGFGLSWLVIACTTNHAGILKSLLSYPGLTPLSKLSFSVYLISPLIINLIYSSSETPIHLDFFLVIVYVVGFFGISYFIALILSLVLEMPFVRIGKLFLGPKNHLNQLNQS